MRSQDPRLLQYSAGLRLQRARAAILSRFPARKGVRQSDETRSLRIPDRGAVLFMGRLCGRIHLSVLRLQTQSQAIGRESDRLGRSCEEIEMTYLDLLSLPAHRPILLRFLLSLLRLLGARSAPGTPEKIRSRILQDCEDSGRLYHAFACGQGGHLDGVCHPLYGHYDRHLVGCPWT